MQDCYFGMQALRSCLEIQGGAGQNTCLNSCLSNCRPGQHLQLSHKRSCHQGLRRLQRLQGQTDLTLPQRSSRPLLSSWDVLLVRCGLIPCAPSWPFATRSCSPCFVESHKIVEHHQTDRPGTKKPWGRVAHPHGVWVFLTRRLRGLCLVDQHDRDPILDGIAAPALGAHDAIAPQLDGRLV